MDTLAGGESFRTSLYSYLGHLHLRPAVDREKGLPTPPCSGRTEGLNSKAAQWGFRPER